MEVQFSKSDNPAKKYKVVVERGDEKKTIHFGDSSLKDYTLYNALEREERKRLYMARHKVRENWSDPMSAGFWSRWILWNKPTVSASLADAAKRFGFTYST